MVYIDGLFVKYANMIPICRIPVVPLLIFGFISNIAMLIHVKISRKYGRKSRLMIMHIAVINITFQVFMINYAVYLRDIGNSSVSLFFLINFLKCCFSLLQLGANIALACDRYLCTLKPFKYRQQTGLKSQWRLILISTILSIVLGVCSGLSNAFFKTALVESVIVTTSRFFTYVALCYLYYSMFKKLRQTRMEQLSRSSSTLTIKRDKSIMRLALGVTTSFMIFNLPIISYNVMYRLNPDCGTLNGKLTMLVVTLLVVNFSFDPLWYLYTVKSSKR